MKKNILHFLKVGLIVLSFSSCDSSQRFDSNEWKKMRVDWWMTDVREKMVMDLISSDTLIGMNEEKVVELLGSPESKNELAYQYLIREKYGNDIDPEYISRLIIEFDSGQVRNCRIEK